MEKSRNLLELGTRRGAAVPANDLGAYWDRKGERAKALELFHLAVRLRPNKTNTANLAYSYMSGYAGEPDLRKATYFAIFGARLGSDRATDLLYELISRDKAVFKDGYGPPPSFDIIELARLLAESGLAGKQVELAKILEAGGNLTEARLWYSKAAKNGDSYAEEAKDALKRLEVNSK